MILMVFPQDLRFQTHGRILTAKFIHQLASTQRGQHGLHRQDCQTALWFTETNQITHIHGVCTWGASCSVLFGYQSTAASMNWTKRTVLSWGLMVWVVGRRLLSWLNREDTRFSSLVTEMPALSSTAFRPASRTASITL